MVTMNVSNKETKVKVGVCFCVSFQTSSRITPPEDGSEGNERTCESGVRLHQADFAVDDGAFRLLTIVFFLII